MREQALCLLFEYSYHTEADINGLDELYKNALDLYGYEDDAYTRTVFFGVINEAEKLDGVISKYAVGWKIERISRISLAIMRLCLYECRYVEDVPVEAALNEAVELAKKYDTEQAPAFINGVLNSAVKGEGLI
jgi:N utilization substance protein B